MADDAKSLHPEYVNGYADGMRDERNQIVDWLQKLNPHYWGVALEIQQRSHIGKSAYEKVEDPGGCPGCGVGPDDECESGCTE